jgi:threonine synthase
MWKAFEEMEALGWIGPRRPRMVCVQSDGCAPIVRALREGRAEAAAWADPVTEASGIRVPAAVADFVMLDVIRRSGGTGVTVSDAEIADAVRLITSREGIFGSPEGAATLAGLRKLLDSGDVAPDERIVLFNTGSGLKYPEWFPVDLPVLEPGRPFADYGIESIDTRGRIRQCVGP